MKLLGYFGRHYAGAFVLMQLGLVIVVLATSFVENAGALSRSDASGDAALGLALFGAVEFGHQVFPVACFLAVLVAGTQLARSGELLAAQAAGVGEWRVRASFLGAAAVIALAGVVSGELFVPRAMALLDRHRRSASGAQSLGRYYDRHAQWFRQGEVLLYLPTFDPAEQSFGEVVVYRMRDGLLGAVIDADELVHENGGWWLVGAREHVLASGDERWYERLALPLAVAAQDLAEVAGDPRFLRSHDIVEYARRRERAGFDAASYWIELHNRAAFPLSALAMFLLAVPWALDPGRRRSLAANLGAGVIAVGVLLALTQVFRVLALGHQIPPAAGAWGIDVLCLALTPVSQALYRRRRTRGSVF